MCLCVVLVFLHDLNVQWVWSDADLEDGPDWQIHGSPGLYFIQALLCIYIRWWDGCYACCKMSDITITGEIGISKLFWRSICRRGSSVLWTIWIYSLLITYSLRFSLLGASQISLRFSHMLIGSLFHRPITAATPNKFVFILACMQIESHPRVHTMAQPFSHLHACKPPRLHTWETKHKEKSLGANLLHRAVINAASIETRLFSLLFWNCMRLKRCPPNRTGGSMRL